MPKKDKSKLNILIVDDEPLVCEAVKMLLTYDGHQIEAAGDGPAALAIYAPGKFDLVMLDFEMPGMKGDQLAVAIKEISPTQPILLLTAHGDMLRSSGRLLPGVDMIVDKPFRLDTLRAAIEKSVAEGSDQQVN